MSLQKTIKDTDILGMLKGAIVVGDRPWRLNMQLLKSKYQNSQRDTDMLIDGLWDWISEMEKIKDASARIIKESNAALLEG